MNRLMKKWRSNRGASITFALLLFLVCAMVSTVVVVAASTAGGRFSSLDEMDMRYYAVTTAEERLCKIFDGKSAILGYTVGETTNTEGVTTLELTSDVYTTAAQYQLIAEASEMYVKGRYGNATTALNAISISGEDSAENAYTCNVIGEIINGMLRMTISAKKGDGTDGAPGYNLYVTFAPTFKETLDTTTDTMNATVTWKLNKIEKTVPAA